MSTRAIQLLTIFLTVFIDILGFGIVIPVLPLYGEHFHATKVLIGLTVGIFSLAQFIFAPIWGKVSDRIGRKPVLLFGVFGNVIGYLVMARAHTIWMLLAGRLIAGIAGANISAAQAYMADISTPENRAKAMGLLGAAFGLGFVFGPALGGWASGQFNSFAMPFYIAAGMSCFNFLFVLFRLPESRPPHERVARTTERIFPNLFSHVRRRTYLWTLASYFLVIVGFSIMTTLFALYLWHRFKLSVLDTGYILAAIGVVGVIIQGGLIGRLVKRFGEAPLALAGSLIMASGLAGLAFTTASRAHMIFAAIVVGIGNSLLMPTLSAIASRSADPDWQGRALGVMQSSGSLARFVGPMIAGILLSFQLDRFSGAYAFLPMIVSAVVLLVAAVAVNGTRSGR